MARKKVLHIIYDLSTAGAQTVVMNYFRELQDDPDYEALLCVGGSYRDTPYAREAKEKGYQVIYSEYSPVTKPRLLRPVINWVNYNRSYRKVIKAIKPDIVHTHLTKELAFATLPSLSVRAKRVHTLHSDPYAIPTRFYVWGMLAFHIFGFKAIGVTEIQAKKAEARYHLRDIPVVHNGVYLEKYRIEETKESIRKSLELPEDSFIIGTVGRLDKVKNYPFLIGLFAEYAKGHTNSILLFTGEGQERAHLESLCEDHKVSGQVVFLKNQENVERIYKAMDVFMLTSFSESSSIVTVEAQLSGTRCVIADTIPESVIITQYVNRLSFGDPLSKWIDAIDGKLETETPKNTPEVFSIPNTINELKNVYFKL